MYSASRSCRSACVTVNLPRTIRILAMAAAFVFVVSIVSLFVSESIRTDPDS